MFEIAGGIILAVFFFYLLFVAIGLFGAVVEHFRLNAEARREDAARERESLERQRQQEAEEAALRAVLDREIPRWSEEVEFDFVSSARFYFEEYVKTDERWQTDWARPFPEFEISLGAPFFGHAQLEDPDWEISREILDLAKDDLLRAGFNPGRAVSLIMFVYFGLFVDGLEPEDYCGISHQEYVARAKAADYYLRIRSALPE